MNKKELDLQETGLIKTSLSTITLAHSQHNHDYHTGPIGVTNKSGIVHAVSILHAGTVCTWCMPCAGDCMMFLLDLSLEDRVPFCSLVVVYYNLLLNQI